MLSRHLVESLAISPFISGKQVVDVGTGAGLPGIPLAIANPAVHYTLLDSNGKKSRFLLEVKRALILANVEIETVRVESWLPTKRFDSVVTRAFADLATTLVRVEHVLTEQGMVYAMKTQQAQHEIESLPDATRQVTTQIINVPGRDWSFQLLAVQPRAEAAL
jgi:16S rRNA (guanine527-N7)-methyltransferase